jgi:sialic acid synthase SpsE
MPEPEIVINGRRIGPSHPPYVVCELSANHNGELERAIRMLETARRRPARTRSKSRPIRRIP